MAANDALALPGSAALANGNARGLLANMPQLSPAAQEKLMPWISGIAKLFQRKENAIANAQEKLQQTEAEKLAALEAAKNARLQAEAQRKEMWISLAWRGGQMATGIGVFVGFSVAEAAWPRFRVPKLDIRWSGPAALVMAGTAIAVFGLRQSNQWGQHSETSQRAIDFLTFGAVGAANAFLSPLLLSPPAQSSAPAPNAGTAQVSGSSLDDDGVIFGR